MFDHRGQIRKSAVVVESAFGSGEQAAERGGAIALVRGPVGLEIINANFGWRVLIPTWFRKQRRHMTGGAIGFVVEQHLAAASGGRIKTTGRRLGRFQSQLV